MKKLIVLGMLCVSLVCYAKPVQKIIRVGHYDALLRTANEYYSQGWLIKSIAADECYIYIVFEKEAK